MDVVSECGDGSKWWLNVSVTSGRKQKELINWMKQKLENRKDVAIESFHFYSQILELCSLCVSYEVIQVHITSCSSVVSDVLSAFVQCPRNWN